MAITLANLESKRAHWLLTIEFAGRRFQWGDQTVHIPTEDSATYPFAPYTSLTAYEEQLSLFGLSASSPSISVELHFPYDTDIALLIRQGQRLAGSPAEISVWFEGSNYEDREVQLKGQVFGPTWGARGEPVRFTVQPSPMKDAGLILHPSARVDFETWPNHATNARGKAYPLILGAPGPYTDPDGTARNTSGSPAYYVDTTNHIFLIADRPATAAGSTGTLFESDDSSQSFTVAEQDDALGRPVAILDASTPGGLTRSASNEYWFRWDNDGGAPSVDSSSALPVSASTPHAIIEILMRRSSLRVDRAQITSQLRELSSYRLDGAITDPEATPMGWILDNLTDILPLSVVASPAGFRFIPYPFEATTRDVRAALTEGPLLKRLASVRMEGQDAIENTISVEYAKRSRTGEYQATAITVGRTAATNAEHPNAYSSSSVSREANISDRDNGERSRAITTDIIYAAATAFQVGAWRARAFGFPRTRLRYTAHPRWAFLSAGDVVTLTDTDLHYADQIAVVYAKRWGGGQLELELLILEDPIRGSQPAAP